MFKTGVLTLALSCLLTDVAFAQEPATRAEADRQRREEKAAQTKPYEPKGDATRMLELAVRIANEQLGIDDVLLVCADSNIASIRVIERNGGLLQDVIHAESGKERLRRFRIRR